MVHPTRPDYHSFELSQGFLEFGRVGRTSINGCPDRVANVTGQRETSWTPWDGSVKSTASNAWVPDGLSLWELSVNKSPGTKADKDYGKRHDTPDGSATDQCVYIEAILRPWIKRHDWASDRSAEGRWNQVRAYGLDEIDAWLEAAPITRAWFSEQLRLNPYGLRSAESWWDSWSIQTSPAISADLVLAGRDTAVDALEGRLAVAQITTIAGASLEETQAFVAAVAVRSHQRGEGQLLARTAFVDNLATWRSLIETQTPLVLVPVIDGLASEVPSGCLHHIVVPATSTAISDIELPAVDASGAPRRPSPRSSTPPGTSRPGSPAPPPAGRRGKRTRGFSNGGTRLTGPAAPSSSCPMSRRRRRTR